MQGKYLEYFPFIISISSKFNHSKKMLQYLILQVETINIAFRLHSGKYLFCDDFFS
jgi:hypothetical protein